MGIDRLLSVRDTVLSPPIPETEGSWALPLRHERITSWESPIDKAVWQLKQVCKYLPQRPISVWDSSSWMRSLYTEDSQYSG